MQPFEFVVPENLAGASADAAARGSTIKAGGIDLLDRLKERIEQPGQVVDLNKLSGELGKIEAGSDGSVRIGALATLQEVADAAELGHPAFAAVHASAGEAATPQVRNRATVGGNLLQMTRCWYRRSAGFACAHDGTAEAGCLALAGDNRYHSVMAYADCVRVHPSNLAPALYALGAAVEVQSGDDVRRMPIQRLYPETPTAAAEEHTLQSGEILTAVLLPAPVEGQRSSYRESREKHSHDWATTAAAVSARLEDGVVRDLEICLGAVAPVPVPMPAAAKLLIGERPTDELLAKVVEAAFAGAQPLTQNGYKLVVGKAVLLDALRRAIHGQKE